MKSFFTTLLLIVIIVLALGFVFRDTILDDFGFGAVAEKPVIYLYPEEECEVHAGLELNGEMTVSYPAYPADGWTVTASPDGTLKDAGGRTYDSLFWEAELDADYDLSRGFCVAGTDTAAFLEQTLAVLGLSETEANAFIVYWLPRMQDNAYNLITFQSDAYTDAAELNIEPAPDTVIRVFMVWQALDKAVDIAEPTLPAAPARDGFTVVEWGGAEITG
ncbi:MAG: hypothetical protein E7604_06255 [Ruminococcaceae bacterium]|nr:hypothetical protein [Oscillospiraceae bacterium]